jgi:hypothetical protein
MAGNWQLAKQPFLSPLLSVLIHPSAVQGYRICTLYFLPSFLCSPCKEKNKAAFSFMLSDWEMVYNNNNTYYM